MTVDPLAPMRCLCIGGSYDGEYVEAVPMGRLGQLRLPEKAKPSTVIHIDNSYTPKLSTFRCDFYHIEQICYPEDIVFSLWVLDGIKPHEAMERLIRRYANAAVKALPIGVSTNEIR